MPIVLSHSTAFFYWRTFTGRRTRIRPLVPASGMTERLEWAPQLAAELAQLGIEPAAGRPLHLLFANQALRPSRASKTLPPLVAHVQPAELPAGSILGLSEHVAIVSPELCFLQMADRLSTAQLILAGDEFCGTYALLPDPEYPDKTVVAKRAAPLTSANDLAVIVASPAAARNRRARTAAPHVVDGAASPMEAKTEMLLCLPTAMGGYALPQPALNPELTLGDEARALYPHATVRPDLFWEEARFDAEYDGDVHEGELSRTRDAGRRAALEAEEITIVTLTYPQVADDATFDVLARRIAKALGTPVRIRMENDGHASRRAKLRQELELA